MFDKQLFIEKISQLGFVLCGNRKSICLIDGQLDGIYDTANVALKPPNYMLIEDEETKFFASVVFELIGAAIETSCLRSE